ncbi:NAD-dependent epimerase/dehydratase family protein [Thalassoglobus polymorphus]|uniref:NAD dependent epimerase/dehydratase family protein n=1 Tax=Thalassoglobus polymorphus TaxID=2527994 RepID=A0A517QR98_9PLAN|nr:epimerase [Thalassoglobus polymorphus]QDT34151.1 hypothetical protein Mal48_34110 [Thalassoglobus polymorphus]
MNQSLPESIRDEAHLEELLSEPTEGAIDALRKVPGDIILLGAGGKMGPSLARMVKRAADAADTPRRVIAVSRFSDASLPKQLNEFGIETISGDLLDEEFIASLPDVPNVIFMTGAKFGTSGDESLTWAMNVWLPSVVCRKYRNSRITAFSTGNVYPLVPIESGGSVESDPLQPIGEYANTAVGRERMFSYFCNREGNPTSLVRLNYSVEMRYGVLVDLAKQVMAGGPIDVSMGYANVIWQADANAMTIQSMADASSPAFVVNVSGPEIFSTKEICERYADLFGTSVDFTGEPAPTALLNNGSFGHQRYGAPRVSLEQLQTWIADWLKRDQVTWGKPTHFEVRDGKF